MSSMAGNALDHALRDVSKRRKLSKVVGPYEDVFWPRTTWLELWREFQSRGNVTGEPDDKQPIVVNTATFTLRIHALPPEVLQ